MDIFDVIERRHCYRGAYREGAVPREDLRRIVEAALKAPSGKNAQTTRFVIVDEPDIVRQIAGMHEVMPAFQQAGAFIACIVDKDPAPVYEGYDFQVEDCAAAVQNMLLAVTALGYGSVWVDGWLRLKGHAETIGRLLAIPEDKQIRIILPIGVPAEQRPFPVKMPFEERAWFNRYGA